MIPKIAISFTDAVHAASTLIGMATAMALFKSRHEQDPGDVYDDADYVECGDYFLDKLNDPYERDLIKTAFGRDVYDEITANDANDIATETELRRMGAGRN